jgi:hypothetical protein
MPAGAVIRGSFGADLKAQAYEESRDYRGAVIWRQASAFMLERLSGPMFRAIRHHYRQERDWGGRVLTERTFLVDVVRNLDADREALRKDLPLARRQPPNSALESRIREEAEDFTLRWMVAYPDRFFRFGLYRDVQAAEAARVRTGHATEAVELEAQARETCARQYREVLGRYLCEGAVRYRRAGRLDRAERYDLLARHYNRLADLQVREAREIRARRGALADYLARPTANPDPQAAPLVRRLEALRLAVLSRPATHDDALAQADGRSRRKVLSYFAETFSAHGLLYAARGADPQLAGMASGALQAGVERHELALVHSLVVQMQDEYDHASVLRLNELLATYCEGRAVSDRFSPADDAAIRRRWSDWWQSSLTPGMSVRYFQDSASHVPLGDGPETAALACLMFPAGARAGRWETVLQCPGHEVGMLMLGEGGTAQVMLDGVPQTVTADPETHSLVARLLLTRGEHVLRVGYARPPDSAPARRFSFLTVNSTSEGRVHFFRHVSATGEVRDSQLAAATSLPLQGGGSALLALLLVGAAYGRRGRRLPPAPARKRIAA